MFVYHHFVVLLFITAINANIEVDNETVDFTCEFHSLIRGIYAERSYKTIFLQTRSAEDCIDEHLLRYWPVPIINLGAEETMYLKNNYNSEMLAIMCLATLNDLNLLDLTSIYYTYTPFPSFELEQHKLTSAAKFFINRLTNLKGKILLTLPDLFEPRTILYTDKSGQQKIGGYIGKFMHYFAAYYNCTLQFAYNITPHNVYHNSELLLTARNETVDIPISLISAQKGFNINEFSYPVEIGKLLTMIPVEPPVPTNMILLQIFNLKTNLCLFVIHWLLSLLLTLQTSKQRLTKKNSTAFTAKLTMLLTDPPTVEKIHSFDDVRALNMKIMVCEQDIPRITYYAGETFWQNYKPIFKIVKTFNEFQSYRQALNTKYAYLISLTVWPVFEEQQNYFATKLFRLSTDLSFTNFILYAFAVQENSFYKEPLRQFCVLVQETGIYQHWYAMSFYEMVKLEKINFVDLSGGYEQHS
ncbi:uncharacterized protein LOC119663493, partial [Teleopsis dalmanni]|uniref:uncharacterized protein LOC119663493 n=1 Tax=Teleopsis dalmanni TaxID=139649 RepID=UPI0018CCEDF8